MVHVFIFGNSFLTVHNLGVVRKMKVGQKGPMQCILTVILALLSTCARPQQLKVLGELACLTS